MLVLRSKACTQRCEPFFFLHPISTLFPPYASAISRPLWCPGGLEPQSRHHLEGSAVLHANRVAGVRNLPLLDFCPGGAALIGHNATPCDVSQRVRDEEWILADHLKLHVGKVGRVAFLQYFQNVNGGTLR